MPTPSPHVLIWSEARRQYELQSDGQLVLRFRPEDDSAFSCWLAGRSAFAFVGRAGRVSVVKESRPRGTGYWYASHRRDHHTRKRYLGRTDTVTFARLEQVAETLMSASSSPAPYNPMQSVPSSDQKVALPSSKFSPPRFSALLVERAHLLGELDAIYTHPLTLLSSSAGSGKTTLLSAWVSRQGTNNKTARHDFALAWLSLEAFDNDPARFWDSIIAALRTCLPTVGDISLSLLHSQEAPPHSTILTHLLDEMRKVRGEVILVLDDYHVIEDASIHESMLFFIEHLPSTVHLVLATRTDPALPLSRWRVRGQLAEIRSGDLRFTPAETNDFLLHCMSLPLSEADVATLHHRTEGWIAGLQLAALSLRKQQDPSGWIADFAGNYRYLLDYVRQDILAGLPISLQHFLLQTSLLTRMNAAICQAITACPTIQASQVMLEEIDRANLFVVPLDEQRQWYRYHDLFREALRTRLYAEQPDMVPILHSRAARWYEAQGEWREAVTHALAAHDYPHAAALMEQAAPHFWLSGEARTIHTWVLSLPDTTLRDHTHLALNAALRFLNSVHISTETVHANMAEQVQQTILRIEDLMRSHHASSFSEAEMALIRRRLRLLSALSEVRAYFRNGDRARLRLLTQEIDVLPPDEDVNWKLIPLTFDFWLTLALQRDITLLVPRLQAAKQWISQAGDHLVTFRVMTWLARAYIHAGQLHLAHQECIEALALLDRNGGSTPVAGYLLSSLFDIAYAWNRLDEASEALHRLRRISHDWQQVELLALSERSAAQLALARGDLGAAQIALQQAEAVVEREEFVNNARWVVETRVHIWLASRNLGEASRWADQTTPSLENWDPLRNWEVLLLARVLLAHQRYSQTVGLLERSKAYFDQSADIEKMIEWMALYLVALHHAGDREQTVLVADRLFTMTEPEGHIRLYLDAGEPMRQTLEAISLFAEGGKLGAPHTSDNHTNAVIISSSYVSRLLDAFAQEGPKRDKSDGASPTLPHIPLDPLAARNQNQPIEPLSRQELRVLHLLVAGKTYTEMAETLVVSTNTIKTQVSSIYRKLNVSRRAEAIIAATAQFHLL